MTASACPKCGAALEPGASPAGLCPACLLEIALSSDVERGALDPALSEALSPGTAVGPFRIVGVLGCGGMATVYEAYDQRLERSIALKVLSPEFLHAGEFARRFEKEARVVAKLEHPNIVPIYASGIDESIPWMSMRLLAGGNMGMLLKRGRPGLTRALHLLRGIADALDYAHARGVVHRDIKPTNILLDGADGVYVGDFGLAQLLDGAPGLTRTGILNGTPHYMAPEQAMGNGADYRSDIYSLGIVAYETFVGAVPFTADSPVAVLMKHVQQPLPTPPDGLVAPALMRTIETAASKDPGDRWPSAGAFVTALAKAIDARPYEVTAPTRHALRSRGARAAAVGGTAVAVAAFAWFSVRGPAPSSPAFAPREEQRSALQETPPGASPALTVPPAVGPVPPVSPTRPPVQSVRTEVQQEVEDRIESATPAETVPANTGASSTTSGPLPSMADVAPSRIVTEPNQPAVTLPAAPAVVDVITPPVRIRTVTPVYPDVARAAELEGDVLLEATVGVDGRISDVKVLRMVHPVLDEAARRAVLQYEYAPGRRNDVPEAAPVRITVSFRLR